MNKDRQSQKHPQNGSKNKKRFKKNKNLTILHSKTLEKFFSKIKKINKSGSREKKEIMATVL